MASETVNFYLLQDLEDKSRTARLANSDLSALRAD